MTTKVILSKNAQRAIEKIPRYIVDKLDEWIESVETDGIYETRKCSGYHDEPLKGKLHGLRSIRLSKAYRAIYVHRTNGSLEIIFVTEINKHDY